MATRQQLLNYMVERGYSRWDVDKVLKSQGYAPTTEYERQRVREGKPLTGNVLQNLGGNVTSDLKDFASGLNTMGTIGYKYITDGKFRDALGNQLSNYAKQRGVLGVAEDVANTMIAPYNISIRNLGTDPINTMSRIASGVANHPVTAVLDFAPLTKLIPKEYKLGNVLERSNAPKIVKQFIPSDNINKVNRAIKTGRGIVDTKAKDLTYSFKAITQSPDKASLQQAFRNVSTGKWEGDKETIDLTRRLLDVQGEYNKELVDLGINPEMEKKTAIAQMIMEDLNPVRSNQNIYTGRIMKAMEGDNEALKALGVDKNKFSDLIAQGNDRYDKGLLRPISHRFTFSTPEKGLVPVEDYLKGRLANRNIGWATPEELVKTAPKAYEDIAQMIALNKSGRVSLEQIAKSVGTKVKPSEVQDYLKANPNHTIISPEAFNQSLREDYGSGKLNSIVKRVGNLKDGLDPTNYEVFKNNLYGINKDYLDPFINSVRNSRDNNLFGKLNSNWKYVQLITPKYFVENRLGNSILNTLEGAGPTQYIKAYNKAWRDLAPKRLHTDTSYQGLLGSEFAGSRTAEALKRSLIDTKEGISNKDWLTTLTGVNKVMSNLIIPTESAFEFTDRYANFIKQAERLSRKSGKKVEDIIKASDKDPMLYNRLITPVENSLGDYTGRNWAIDPKTYNILSTTFPFFKYPTQAIRTLFYQAQNNPLRYQALVGTPAKIGANVWDNEKKAYDRGNEEFGGLFINSIPGAYAPALLQQFDANPISAGTEFLYNLTNNPGNLSISPLFDLARIKDFKDRYGNTASSPKYYNAGGNTYILDNNGNPTPQVLVKPTLGDIATQLTSTMANLYFAPAIAWNRYIGPGIAQLTNQTWYPNYDTSILGQIGEGYRRNPIYSGRINSRGRRGIEAFTGPATGSRFIQVYPTYETGNARDMRTIYKKLMRQRMNKEL